MGTKPITEDLPTPDEIEVQQREYPVHPLPVKPVGPTTTHELPAPTGAVFSLVLSTTRQRIVHADLKRKRTILLLYSGTATDRWLIARSQSGTAVPWPANVPLVLESCDELWGLLSGAGLAGSDGTLSIIAEMWTG